DGNTARMTVFWDVATVICEYNSVNAGSISGVTAGTARLFSIEVTATSIIYSVTGGTGSPKTYAVLVAALTSATIGMRHFSGTAGKLTYFSDLTYTPSIAFTDPFTSDTKTRYMRLSSTDVTTWVASAEGDVVVTGGKMTLASADDKGVAAILRSYNFGSGEYEFAFNNINDGGGGADTISCMFATQDIGNYLRITLEDNAAGSEILKVFYVTGLTATELATKDVSATYVRGNKTWIKVHYSSETGTIWVYLRDDAGAYPATPDLIVYKSLYPYGKVGFRATVTTAGAGNLNVAFYPATIRAALLVGETNVPATETGFYFRDEFTVDSSGRYLINAGTWAVTGGYYKLTAACGGAQLPFKMSTSSTLDQSVTVTMATTNENKWCSFNFLQDVFVAAVNYPVSGYDVTVGQNGGAKIIYLQRFTAGSGTNIATATLTAGEFPDAGESHIIRVTVTSAGLITVYFDGVSKISITDTTYTSGYSAIGGYQATLGSMDYRFDNLTISGTRYYMAPILRGAQIGRALIGGVDTPCTFFGDDCNWDTSGEWTARASCSWVADTANGWYTLTRNTTTGDAYVDLNSIGVTDHKTFGVDVYLGTATVLSVNFNISGKLYYIEIDATRVRYMGAGQIVSYTTTVGLTTWYRLFIDTSTTGTTKVYWDGVLIISSTTQNSTIAATLTTLYCYGAATKYSRFRNLQINALESTSTNGVTVCIPSPAHGGRFDITEYAKKALVAGTGIQPGIYKMLTRKISTVASASNDYETDNLFQNATDAATVSLETASLSEKAVNTTAWTEDREFVRVAAADAGDSIEFGVQRRQATSLSSDGAPATYVDVMQLVPMYRSEGVGALFGVGDLAFATAQYPCYIRRVEQKNIV
ncbi:MAG: hypothetical protein Q8R70_09365, partial [Methanoregula sp.]|nr:hypothetical protein [Methanoregula sp.]